MKWGKWIENWDMTSLKINTPFLEMEWNPQDEDKDAAWELYIELLTRVTTQSLKIDHGDEQSALLSIHSLFDITRNIIKSNGRNCIEFTKIAVVVLNQVVRPFTARWHGQAIKGAFENADNCKQFRVELIELQRLLRIYTNMLADMAGVENLSDIEKT